MPHPVVGLNFLTIDTKNFEMSSAAVYDGPYINKSNNSNIESNKKVF